MESVWCSGVMLCWVCVKEEDVAVKSESGSKKLFPNKKKRNFRPSPDFQTAYAPVKFHTIVLI